MKFILLLLFTFSAFGATFTPFPPGSPPADSITTKGGLLTSNGSAQAEFPACSDGELIEWDAVETLGFKCVAAPSGGGIPVLTKGALLTSNGSANGELDPCADGEMLEWDSAEANGVKCVAAPGGGSGGIYYGAGITQHSTSSSGEISMGSPITFTSNGNPVILSFASFPQGSITDATFVVASAASACYVLITRNGTEIGRHRINYATGDSVFSMEFIDTAAIVGASTYDARTFQQGSGPAGQCHVFRFRLVAMQL